MSNPVLTDLQRLEKKIDSLAKLVEKGSLLSSKWLRTKEACEYLSISSSQLQVFKNEGYFHAYKIGGTNYYKIEEIDDALENSICEV